MEIDDSWKFDKAFSDTRLNHFTSNTFEHDYIIKILADYVCELRTKNSPERILDKYACILTNFMNGQVVQAVKTVKGA